MRDVRYAFFTSRSKVMQIAPRERCDRTDPHHCQTGL